MDVTRTKLNVKAQKFTLLIVDDDADQRLFMKKAFEALAGNYRIQALAGGNEALAYLKGQGKYADRSTFEFPSYIITDLHMPNGDGFEILDFLKKNPALSVIPVVMLSSSADGDDIRHAYLLGVSSFFAKPGSLPELKALVRVIHAYWINCEVPEVDAEGYAVETNSSGKRGERFIKPKRPQK
jgi:CheY-like chemotaxis protein